MEQQIKKSISYLKGSYFCFWLLPILLIIWGEMCGNGVGIYAGETRTSYYMETLSILLTAVCVPVSLKLFAWVLVHKIDTVGIAKAIHLYIIWSSVRLLLLALPLIVGGLTYYLTMSTTGALCAAITLTASLFCLPGEKRLRRELHIETTDEEE